ncbi:MAG: ABC transporter permease [Sphingomonadales bacterium]|nr:ABC transporter permease [Sphingomonadales bacterium]
MRETPEFSSESDADGALRVALGGPLIVARIGELDKRLRAIDAPVAAVDLSKVTAIDTVGAWLVWRLVRDGDAKLTGASEEATRLIDAVSESKGTASISPERLPPFTRALDTLGSTVLGWREGAVGGLGFLGQVMLAVRDVIREPRRFRGKALIHQMELVGVNSLGIIAMMSFLVGIVIAQQGAVQLQQFGAEILTVNLTGRIALRELGILMTAIMVAGRSGSAFAAQIGTMKLTEEIDAMRTIGVSPMVALVLPRVLAAVLMMPLLGFIAAVVAIIGGATISTLTLDIPFLTFLRRIQEVVPLRDLWVGVLKAPVFGLIVALNGCYQGMQVSGNSEEVGTRTTQAVVQAIFTVIVLDAFFAVFFSKIGWI